MIMYNFTVRPATLKDVEAICKYNKTHGRSALSLEDTEAALQEIISDGTNKVLVAIHSQHIAGYVYAKEIISLTEARYIEIVDFVVSDYYRKIGAGKALVQAVRQWAEQMISAKIVFSAKVYDLERFKAFEEDNYIKDERSLVFFRKL